jgi:hypothetical protein
MKHAFNGTRWFISVSQGYVTCPYPEPDEPSGTTARIHAHTKERLHARKDACTNKNQHAQNSSTFERSQARMAERTLVRYHACTHVRLNARTLARRNAWTHAFTPSRLKARTPALTVRNTHTFPDARTIARTLQAARTCESINEYLHARTLSNTHVYTHECLQAHGVEQTDACTPDSCTHVSYSVCALKSACVQARVSPSFCACKRSCL